MSRKHPGKPPEPSALAPQEYADELDIDELQGEYDEDTSDDFEDLPGAFDQDSLNFDKDARWELEEDESIKEIMQQISNKVNPRGQKDIYCWFKVNFIKSFALSNLDDGIINMYVMDAANTFNREALMKMGEWNLKSYDYPTLSFWIREAIHIYLRRSYKDGERKHRTSRYGGMNDQSDYGEHTKSDFSLGNIWPGNNKRKQHEAQAPEIYDDTERM